MTSLVRSYRYQSVLRRTNRNATSIDVPPHSTGLAFDLMTRYMTAAEQEYLMAVVARLEDEGKVEALREGNRDHLHVFAFADGVRPPAAAIARSLELVAPKPAPRPARVARPAAAQAPPMGFAPSAPRLRRAGAPALGPPRATARGARSRSSPGRTRPRAAAAGARRGSRRRARGR